MTEGGGVRAGSSLMAGSYLMAGSSLMGACPEGGEPPVAADAIVGITGLVGCGLAGKIRLPAEGLLYCCEGLSEGCPLPAPGMLLLPPPGAAPLTLLGGVGLLLLTPLTVASRVSTVWLLLL